jgi:hypothetical protein
MKKGLVILVALVLSVLLSAPMLFAQEKAAGEGEKASSKKAMKLTDEQKTKMEELRADFQMKTIDLKAEREKLAIMLKKEMDASEPSMQEIAGIVKKMSAVREKLQLAGIEHAIAVRKLLGPEWRALRRSGMGERRGMMEKRTMHGRRERPEGAMERPGMPMGPRIGAMKGGRIMTQKRGTCSSDRTGNWNRMMFRHFGKRSGCSGMGGCMMHGGAGHRTGAMEGGCKEAGREGRGAAKETKHKIEIKEVKEKK